MPTEKSRKIDLLMKVTATSNAQLARALNFDASYISRIRSGKRGLPPELPFVEPAAAFFARRISESYQAETLAREMGLVTGWPADKDEAARLIAQWIEGADAPERDAQRGIAAAMGRAGTNAPTRGAQSRAAEVQLFFGNEGRREVALAFLDRVAASGCPCQLLLQSDEESVWMYEDPSFTAEWAARMARLAQIGCTITVIHTVSRSGTEMWEGLREWLPLYLSGMIRPYYYPRLRDGVRMRSLFVARGTCALVSNSVARMQGDALSILLCDAEAVAALEREFDAYLALCQPLAEVLIPSSAHEIAELVQSFQDGGAVTAEIAGSRVCARAGHEALVVTSGEQPVVYRVSEPRLVDAIYGYLERLG